MVVGIDFNHKLRIGRPIFFGFYLKKSYKSQTYKKKRGGQGPMHTLRHKIIHDSPPLLRFEPHPSLWNSYGFPLIKQDVDTKFSAPLKFWMNPDPWHHLWTTPWYSKTPQFPPGINICHETLRFSLATLKQTKN